MRKRQRVLMAPLFFIILTLFVGTSVGVSAAAKQRKKSSHGKASAAATRNKSKGGSGKAVARRASRSRGSESQISSAQTALLRKRGKLTKAERRALASYRSSSRRRGSGRYLARLRAIQAHDSALRNIAASNILKDETAGEDPEIRAAAVNALQGRSGTVVVMDPNSGRVYAVVNQQMALGSPVKPCSTVKMIVGLAALHEGVFDPNQDVQISSRASMNLTDALAHSNNQVFQVLGRLLGYDRVMKYAEDFGFGSKTGINYRSESDGFPP